MKVMIINGSPRGTGSNTMKLTNAVVDGIKDTSPEADIDIWSINDMNIKSCIGCMSCWGRTAGNCVLKDDMQTIYEEFMAADVIIFSFPLYFFGMPGPMKTFVDRLMPLMDTYRGEVKDIGDGAFHEFRYDVNGKKFYVISTCGYGRTNEIYDSLIKEFNFIYGKDGYQAMLCPQGEMFAIPQLQSQIDAYLARYREIGTFIGNSWDIPEDLLKKASEPIIPERAFELLASRYWDSVTK